MADATDPQAVAAGRRGVPRISHTRLPRTCGSTKLASVIVIPNSSVESCTVSGISHCRGLMLNR